MKLNQGKITGTYRVIRVEVQQDLKRRLEVLGMTGGTVLEVMNKKSRDLSPEWNHHQSPAARSA